MATHEYSPETAFGVLMQKIESKDSELAAHIRSVVNEGKDVQEEEPEPAPLRSQSKKRRSYRRTVPYTHKEALSAALNALRAFFIEQPRLINSLCDEFNAAAIESSKQWRDSPWLVPDSDELRFDVDSQNADKAVAIDLAPETYIDREGVALHSLERVPPELIAEQQANVDELESMLVFRES